MNDFQPKITLVKIPVSNIEKSVAYYRDVLGLPESFSALEYGWAQLEVGSLPFCLYEAGKGGGGGTPGTCDAVHFAVSDAAASYEALAVRGANIPSGLETSADGMRFFDIHDPDGNLIKVVQRKA
ncbi:VOC family protein [Candidatus Leptofilum sp.]|uniref:VOC family protein n=1 Tax=Candidatus Leptofilum sp. TaxID=3241576 RepID=UPI003B5CE597